MKSLNRFDQAVLDSSGTLLYATAMDTLQVNVGLRCTLQCTHCHLSCSPSRTEEMNWVIMEKVIQVANKTACTTIDITGGAPELHPHLKKFIQTLRQNKHRVLLRTNLVTLLLPELQTFQSFLRNQEVELVASLPCYLHENVTQQRGEGVFKKSIEALRHLNRFGYGKSPKLPLHLVYNPSGPSLPSDSKKLEMAYRKELSSRFGIEFTDLFTITNMPIGRFQEGLQKETKTQSYVELLEKSFNSATLPSLMCKNQISVRWDGTLFDCDFNLALKLQTDHQVPSHIFDFDFNKLSTRTIRTGNHCFGCTAGCGSSCGGALV